MLRKHQVASSLFNILMLPSILLLPFLKFASFLLGQFLQCIIDLKENVLRVGGGEVSVPFLHGW